MKVLGFSGSIAERFQANEITPLLALVGLLLGLFAVGVTPREEEPQIDVTFANVFIAMPGATAREVENVISFPAEQVLDAIDGVKHVYSVSRPGLSILTVEYQVGVPRNEAIVRLYNEIYSNMDWLPRGLGASPPLIKPMGIDDVPIVTATFWSESPDKSGHELLKVAHAVEAEIKRIPNTRDVYTVGGPDHVVKVALDPQKLAGYGLTVADLEQALKASNMASHAGEIRQNDQVEPVQAGTLLASAEQVKGLVVAVHEGKPVFLSDIATISQVADAPENYVWMQAGQAWKGEASPWYTPAVTLAVAKKPGSNAVQIANAVIDRLQDLKNTVIPADVQVEITRNYGKTANDKAMKLIHKLIFATASVVLLVLWFLGWREAVVVGAAVILTLSITLFASWAWGFTLNRVSLFALIFSIGILVDDAIVVVENIHRHMSMGGKSLLAAIPPAVDEVGGPTILATFTVIAALLPMAFVTGLMGPYMSPIPINASMGMLISLVVALVVTPWLSNHLLKVEHAEDHLEDHHKPPAGYGFFRKIMAPFLNEGSASRRLFLFAAMAGLVVLSGLLVVWDQVVLKMLPFDNKSEFQIVLDMPEGTTLERTNAVLIEMAQALEQVPEIEDVQGYAGTAAPINFNGLVRQYYLRKGDHLGDLQVNLVDKHARERKSHDIALAVRPLVEVIARKYNGSVKVVEVPPGPPVMSPLVAEVYGPDYAGQQRIALALENIYRKVDHVVDVDTSVEARAPRKILVVDQQKAALLGVSQASVAQTIQAALSGLDATYLHQPNNKYPVPVRLELPNIEQGSLDTLLAMPVRSMNGQLVRMSEVTRVVTEDWEQTIYHKDLLPVVFVTGDLAGGLDSPLYGLIDLVDKVEQETLDGQQLEQYFIRQPENPFTYAVKWDGEWQITYETFRDMGIAYSVGLILIYLLVVAQFRSYLVPAIIMVPIPLTIIGVMPGHMLLGAQFTATSMIGMIALAGIIVRNSILLVDFINQEVEEGRPLAEAVIRSAAVRAKPIILTAVAAMMGAFFILDDPIFNGLAVSLIFGLVVSTALTLVVIPLLYYSMRNYLPSLRG